jgi:hypothetical protein
VQKTMLKYDINCGSQEAFTQHIWKSTKSTFKWPLQCVCWVKQSRSLHGLPSKDSSLLRVRSPLVPYNIQLTYVHMSFVTIASCFHGLQNEVFEILDGMVVTWKEPYKDAQDVLPPSVSNMYLKHSKLGGY